MTGVRERDRLSLELGRIAALGGAAILDVVASGPPPRHDKADGSPCTLADLASQDMIVAELTRIFPRVTIIAEESPLDEAPPPGDFILCDPLDGTRDFVEGRCEYSVNLAYVAGGRAVAGAIVTPAGGEVWLGGVSARHGMLTDGKIDALRPIRTRTLPGDGLVAFASRSHGNARTDAALAALPVRELRRSGSAVKMCRIAEGAGDVYPRFSPTMEWDTAAGQAILEAAGGCLLDLDGRDLSYGHAGRGYRNGPFVAWGDRQAATGFMAAIAAAVDNGAP